MRTDRSRPSLLPLLLATSLAGCLAPHPDEERPANAELLGEGLAETFTAGGEATESTDDAAPFYATFGDATLVALVEEALAHNHDLAASAERLRAQAARARITRSAGRPQVEASTTFSRQQNVFVGLPFPGGDVLSSQFSQWNAGIDLAWEVDLWGRIAAATDAATQETVATAADLAAARLSIAAQVTRGWFGLREADRQLALARRTTETYQQSLGLVRDRFDAGLSGALDLRLAEANVATSEANVSAAERGMRVASRQIEVLLGRFPGAELESAGDFGELPPPIPPGLPADLLGRRPDLFAAERRMAAAEAQAEAARLDRWPNIVLTSSVGRTSDEFDDLLDGDFTVWSIAGRLAGPLIDGGRRRARIAETLAQLRASRASFAALALLAFFEVENAMDAERFAGQRMEQLRRAVDASREATSLADDQYREGLVAIDLVLESQRRQLAAESSWLRAQLDLFQARVDLHVALGGGFDVTAEEPPVDPGDGDED